MDVTAAAEPWFKKTLLRDRFWIRRRLERLRIDPLGLDVPEGLPTELARRIAQSLATAETRRRELPPLRYDESLPIFARRDEIVRALREHQVVVLAGETGSGKSTQLPKFCLEAGYGIRGLVGHTQPRRIAARSVAARVAQELEWQLGQEVGVKIRFGDQTSERTYIKLMTDGILLAETRSDRFLEQYEVLIVDEAHERSLNIDFLLGILRRLVDRRPELRLVITSATIDVARFQAHFATPRRAVPIITIEGRTYPVEVRYRPLWDEETGVLTETVEGIVAAVRELAAVDYGHILIFLPTERDIREVAHRLRSESFLGCQRGETELLPLYARLSMAEQQRIFQPVMKRRIVLATNVAESSLTVPGIRSVIDTGTARISRYQPRSKVQRLPIEPVSRASLQQRAGRCGRVAPGICLRLFSEAEYQARKEFAVPEILRTNLAAVILQSLALQLGPVDEFPFLDPPRSDTIQDGYRTLFEIGAIDEERRLTPLGRDLSGLPVDPRIGRILLAALDEGCLSEILVIASALEIQDPRERPVDRQQVADSKHQPFQDERSDFVGLLKLWDFYHELKARLSRNQMQRACAENFLSYPRMREWSEIHRQLREMLRESGIDRRTKETARGTTGRKNSTDPARYDFEPVSGLSPGQYARVHRALLTGFLSGVAFRNHPVEYTGAGNVRFVLWPGSGTFASKPLWCVVAEIVETNRRYGRLVAAIEPEWIEPLAEHLVKRHYSEPHWHFKRATAMAFERLTLFGLPIVPRRRVPYGEIDPAMSRELFLREGLRHDAAQPVQFDLADTPTTEAVRSSTKVAQQFAAHDAARLLKTQTRQDRLAAEPFYRHNEEVLRKAAKMAAKSRRADSLVDGFAIYRFYDSKIPEEVYDLATLQRWYQQAEAEREPTLRMTLAEFLSLAPSPGLDDEFPDTLKVGGLELPVEYHFAPGTAEDGVTVTVPKEGVRQLFTGLAGWLVPGLVEEKIVALLRTLPKSLRTNFIPAPDVARRIAATMTFGKGDFLREVVARLNRLGQETVAIDDFDLSKLPDHLRLNVRVVDGQGQVQCQGRELAALEELRSEGGELTALRDAEATWFRDNLVAWDIDALPEELVVERGGVKITVYPALVDQGSSVALRLLDHPLEAHRQARRGIRRLYALAHRTAIRAQVSWLPNLDALAVSLAPLLSTKTLRDTLADLLAERAFLGDPVVLPRTREAFQARSADSAERIALATQDVTRWLPRLGQSYQSMRVAWEDRRDALPTPIRDDITQQIAELFRGEFWWETPWEWLLEYPRYLRGIELRLERGGTQKLQTDQEITAEIQGFWRAYLRLHESLEAAGERQPDVESFRWLIEEYRISRFAQTLGTIRKVSNERLTRELKRLESIA